MFSVLALASAAFYGAADFIGGIASRRADTMAVVVVSQGAGLLVVAMTLPLLPPSSPSPADWYWGAAAGLTGGVGVALLYRALAIGRMAVVAPVTAVCAVVVPVAFAMAFGERPGTQAGLGMLLALLAIVLVTRQEPPASGSTASRSGLDLALASGVVIGLFFLALARTSGQAGLWPLVAARLVSVTLFTLLAVLSRRALTMKGTTMWLAVGGGVVDMLANLLYLLASRQGPLTLVVTLTSLYPASTVLLARVVLNERISPHQWLGITCALIAIITIVTA